MMAASSSARGNAATDAGRYAYAEGSPVTRRPRTGTTRPSHTSWKRLPGPSGACVDSRQTTLPPGRVTRAISRNARGTSGTLRTPQPTVTAAKRPSSNGRSRRSPATNARGTGRPRRARADAFVPRALEHLRREVQARHGAPRTRVREAEGEVAGAAAGVERLIRRGEAGLGGRHAAPPRVQPHRHDAVHEVVARGDAAEHRLDTRGVAVDGKVAGPAAGSAGRHQPRPPSHGGNRSCSKPSALITLPATWSTASCSARGRE